MYNFKQNFKNILKLLNQECIVNKYEYTQEDRRELEKKLKTFDKHFYIGREPSRNMEEEIKPHEHNQIYKLKSSSTDNFLSLKGKAETKRNWYDQDTIIKNKEYKFYGETKDISFHHGSQQEYLKEIQGTRTLIELELNTLNEIFSSTIEMNRECSIIFNAFNNQRDKSKTYQKLYSITKRIEGLRDRLEEIGVKEYDSHDCDCYSHDDYYQDIEEVKLNNHIYDIQQGELSNIKEDKKDKERELIVNRIIELKKEEKKLMLKTTKSIEHIDDGGYQETNIDEDIDNARCLNHYK